MLTHWKSIDATSSYKQKMSIIVDWLVTLFDLRVNVLPEMFWTRDVWCHVRRPWCKECVQQPLAIIPDWLLPAEPVTGYKAKPQPASRLRKIFLNFTCFILTLCSKLQPAWREKNSLDPWELFWIWCVEFHLICHFWFQIKKFRYSFKKIIQQWLLRQDVSIFSNCVAKLQ